MRDGNDRETDLLVIGAGLAGVAAALGATAAGDKVLLVDAADHVGGVVRSRTVEDHRFDFGPLTVLLENPAVVQLLEAAGATDSVRVAERAHLRRNLFVDGKVHPLPNGLFGWALSPLLRPAEKMRALSEPMVALRRSRTPLEELSVRRLLEQRLGAGVYHKIAQPLVQGIYGGGITRWNYARHFRSCTSLPAGAVSSSAR